jgi:flagellin
MAMNTYRQLMQMNKTVEKSIGKLASGNRITNAGDDACSLAISEKMKSQIRGLSRVTKNLQDGISLLQTAEGALQETQALLQKMRELAVQAATETNSKVDKEILEQEFKELATQIEKIIDTTSFNSQKLLGGNDKGIGAINIIDKTNYHAGTTIGTISNFKINQKSSLKGTGEISDFNIEVSSQRLVPSSSQVKFYGLADPGDLICVNGFTFEFTENPNNSSPIANYWQVQTGNNARTSARFLEAAFNAAQANTKANTGALDNIEIDVKSDAPPNQNTYIVTFTYAGVDNTIPVAKKGFRIELLPYPSPEQKTFSGGIEEVCGQYSLAISNNFSIGDSLEIEGVTFTAVASGDVKTEHQFAVGANNVETAVNIQNVIRNHSLLGQRFTVDGSGTKIILTERAGTATGENISEPKVTQKSPTSGEYSFDIIANFIPGEKITIGSQTFTFSEDGANNTVKIGQDQEETAANLLNAIETGGFFTNNGSIGNTISIKELQASGYDLIEPTIIPADITYASLTFDITTALAEGETLTVGGVTFEATSTGKGSNSRNIAFNLETYRTAQQQAMFMGNFLAGLGLFKVKSFNERIILTLIDSLEENINDPFVTKAPHQVFTATIQTGGSSSEGFKIKINDLRAVIQNVIAKTEENPITPTEDIFTLQQKLTDYSLSLSEPQKAALAITTIDYAIGRVSGERSTLGALQNRLESAARNSEIYLENLTASEFMIREVDLAKETMKLAKNKIQQQIATKIFTFAYHAPQEVLRLLSNK